MSTRHELCASARAISTSCCAAERQIADASPRVDGRLAPPSDHRERREGGGGAAGELAATHEAEARGLDAEEDVLGDGEVGAERELLVDHGDACAARVVRAGAGDRARRRGGSRPRPWAARRRGFLSSVLLPAPFSPTSAWISPGRDAEVDPRRARRWARTPCGAPRTDRSDAPRHSPSHFFRSGWSSSLTAGSVQVALGHHAHARVDARLRAAARAGGRPSRAPPGRPS